MKIDETIIKEEKNMQITQILTQLKENSTSISSSGDNLYGQNSTESIEQLEKKYELIYKDPHKKSMEASSIAIQLGLKYMETGNYQKALEIMEKVKNKVLY